MRRRGRRQDPATQQHSHPWSKEERKICRIEKYKSQEANGRWII